MPEGTTIQNVKIGEKNVTIKYYEIRNDGKTDSTTKNCSDLPEQKFVDAMQKLAPHVHRILEIPGGAAKQWSENVIINEVNFKHNSDAELCGEIKGYRNLMKNDRRMPLHMPFIVASEEPGHEFSDDLDAVIVEANRYLDGARIKREETADMFEDQDEDQNPLDEDEE